MQGIRVVDKLLCAIINRGNGRAEVFIASITCSILSYVLLAGLRENREEALGFPLSFCLTVLR
jgi:hypothetical protein